MHSKLKIATLSLGLIAGLSGSGCNRTSNSPDTNRVPVTPVTRSQNADGTIWHVTSKSCNAAPVPLAGSEKLQFDSAEFAHVFLTSDDNDKSCSEADVYGRVIQDSHVQDNIYTETTTLVAQAKRIVCTDKNSDSVISDITTAYTDSATTMILSLGSEYGTAAVNGSAACPNGTLNFHLKRK